MDLLCNELIEMIYDYLLLPNNALRFSLVDKHIRRSLPIYWSRLFNWKQQIRMALGNITSITYGVLKHINTRMSIRKYDNKISIYQLLSANSCSHAMLRVYVYVNNKYVARYHLYAFHVDIVESYKT